jgi:protoporphyrinogen oxidase
MSTRNEIHVVGAGLAGLTVAAYVARAGTPVVVHETRNRLGGRATTDDRDGFRFDQGPHALYRGGAAERVLAELGIHPVGAAPDVRGVLVRGGALHRSPAGPVSLLGTTALGWRGKVELARLLATLPRLRPAEHAHRTAADWIDGTVRDPRARDALATLVRLTSYANHPEAMSAEVAITMLQAGTGPGVHYLARGWDQLVEALAATPGIRIVAGEPVHDLPDAAAVVLACGGPAAVHRLLGTPGSDPAHGSDPDPRTVRRPRSPASTSASGAPRRTRWPSASTCRSTPRTTPPPAAGRPPATR